MIKLYALNLSPYLSAREFKLLEKLRGGSWSASFTKESSFTEAFTIAIINL